MNANNRNVTNGPWGVSSTWAYKGKATLNIYRLIDGKHFRDGRGRFMHGTLDGITFDRTEQAEIDRMCVLYGYSKPYGRNSCKFVMSRAARRRGHKTTDWMYLGRVKRGG